jgi:hypothetical protein
MDNIKTINYLQTDINFYNSMFAGGSGDGTSRIFVMTESPTTTTSVYLGLTRREKFINGSDITGIDEESNLTDRLAVEKLLYTQQNYFDIELSPDNQYTFTHAQSSVYNTFSLGDVIKVRYKSFNYEDDLQILSVTEYWVKDNVKTVKLQLGKAIPTISSKIAEQQKYVSLLLRR